MEKIIGIQLNKYPIIPHSLRVNPSHNVADTSTRVNLARLFHHYYLDSYGRFPPSPDPARFEYLSFLTAASDFRFQGAGVGASVVAKRNRSTELGQAFCRWFLYDHLNITYFAHMQDVIDREMIRAFEGCKIKRIKNGNAPDYFCAENVNRIFLAEAKGRYTPITFKKQEFANWRKQFNCVEVVDASGMPRKVKGHVVATFFATEENPAKISTVYAEDPESPGEGLLEGESAGDLVLPQSEMDFQAA